jgi:tRNA modification GTPase
MTDTIYALATAPGRAGSAVDAVRTLASYVPLIPYQASLHTFHDFEGETIDRGLLLWFAGPASFTGEDVAEFHVHGGRAIASAMLGTLSKVKGLRMAERGEFTRRAVENGKLDLTRAEAIADLVEAETEAQRKQAAAQYEGSLYQLAEGWRARLIKALAWAEAAIDFAEDEVPETAALEVEAAIKDILAEMQALLRDGRRGEILREGLHLTVIGPPNAGKSSLLNALARRDVAIVSEIPGTTRDVIEARLDLHGYPVIVADTAGLRETGETIEAEGVRRARARADSGDLVLLLVDGSVAEPFAGVDADLQERADLTVWNKADLPWPEERADALHLSLKTGEGLNAVVGTLGELAEERLFQRQGEPALTRERHREAVATASEALERALAGNSAELLAEDLRLALRGIGRLTGQVDVEELLDVIFRDFCIGK